MTKRSFKTLILMCWIVLMVCVVIKLFGGNWFEFATENDKFIKFCEFVDNTMWVKVILSCVISITTSYPVYLLIYNKKKFNLKYTIILISIIIVRSLLSWIATWTSYVIDLLILILLPIILTKKWKRVLIVNVGVFILQLICLFIRNVSLSFNYDNTFVMQTLMQIDYIIMLILCYLYNIKYFIKEDS